MEEQRLEAFERMLAFIQGEYDAAIERMAQLKAAGKEKTVTYRQLMGNKLQYQSMLSLYKCYGLWQEDADTASHP